MSPLEKMAFESAKEIVVARMANTTVSPNKDGGKWVADFFEEVYNRLAEIVNRA